MHFGVTNYCKQFSLIDITYRDFRKPDRATLSTLDLDPIGINPLQLRLYNYIYTCIYVD